jgi:hypothetical protein
MERRGNPRRLLATGGNPAGLIAEKTVSNRLADG